MWIEQELAGLAAQAGPRDNRAFIGEGMPGDGLLLAPLFAVRTPELSVEDLERVRCWCELVHVPFDGLLGENGVHLDESAHESFLRYAA